MNDKFDEDISALDSFLGSAEIDAVIISSPPHTHGLYIKWALQSGLDIICDKPAVANIGQSTDPAAASALMEEFDYLCELQSRSAHRKHTDRPCFVYMPLMRRVSSPYNEIINGLQEVFDLTDQPLTYLLTCRSDGCYRFAEEHDRPGAHGFRLGLGRLP